MYYLLSSSLLRLINDNKPVDIKILENKKVTKFGGYDTRVPIYNNVYNDPFSNGSSKNAYYVLRIFSVLLGLFTIIISFEITKYFFENYIYRVASLFFIVTLPQFCFISSMISNDNLSNTVSALAILYILKYLKEPKKQSVICCLGIILGIGLITKKTFLFIFPALIIINLVMVYKDHIKLKNVFSNFLIFLIFIVLISGWWYYRNYSLYGEFFLTKTEMITAPFHVQPKSLFSMYFINPFFPGLFASFIGVFGWMNMPLPVFSYFVYFFFFIFSIAGLIKKYSFLIIKKEFLFALLLFAFCFAGIVYYNTMYSQFQGRFLFPVISILSVLLIAGSVSMIKSISVFGKYKSIPYLVAGIFLAMDIFSIVKVILFYYDQTFYIN